MSGWRPSSGVFVRLWKRDKEEPGLKVLIAEDDAISRAILKKSFEKFGHECLLAVLGWGVREVVSTRPTPRTSPG